MRQILKQLFAASFNLFVTRVLARVHLKLFWGNLLLTINKSAGFLDHPVFARCLKEIEHSHTYDAYQAPHSIAWRLHTLVWAAQNASALQGDFVECGVFKGDFSYVITQMLDFKTSSKRFYLYDTFAGFSEKYSSPDDFPDAPDFFARAQKIYSEGDLFGDVSRRFAQLANIQVVKGVVPDVFATTCPTHIAFLHLDLNSHAAEYAALEALFDRVVTGGYIVFDDYGWIASRKQKDAIDRFMNPRGYQVLEMPTGQGLVIKR